MTDDGGVVRTARPLSAAEQDALVAQCSRCRALDVSWWLVPALVAGVAVGAARGEVLDVAGAVLVTVVLAVGQVRTTARALRAQHPVGSEVETVVDRHRLIHRGESWSLPQVTAVREEGRVVRLDLGRDHGHVLPDHVDIARVRRLAGVPAPEPAPGPDIVVVPAGTALRVAVRATLWASLRAGSVLLPVALGLVAVLLGAAGIGTTLLVAQVGATVAHVVAQRAVLRREVPEGVPLAREWQGTTLVVRGAHGTTSVPVGRATHVRVRGRVVVVRREGLTPLWLPAPLVTEAARADLLGN